MIRRCLPTSCRSTGKSAASLPAATIGTTHNIREYVHETPNGDMIVTTNTAESFFALLERGHYGVFHQFSEKHLHRYTTEFGFRWNHRKISDGERMVAAIKGRKGDG